MAEEIKAKRKERAKEGITGLGVNVAPATTDSEPKDDYESWRQALVRWCFIAPRGSTLVDSF